MTASAKGTDAALKWGLDRIDKAFDAAHTKGGNVVETPQHTSGPWIAEENPDNNGYIVDAGRTRICDVYQILDIYSRDFKHDEANAVLIARAPDLLAENARLREALKAIVARIDGVFDDPALIAFGLLSTDGEDVKSIATAALKDGAS